MKIILNHSEAVATLTKTFKALHPGGVEVDIVPDTTVADPTGRPVVSTMHHLEAYARVVAMFGDSRFGNQKIAAIKELRNLTPLGLADAKYVIEAKVDRVLCFFNTHRTLMDFRFTQS